MKDKFDELANGLAQSVTRRQPRTPNVFASGEHSGWTLKKFGVRIAGMSFLNRKIRLSACLGLLLAVPAPLLRAGTTPGSLTFSDTPLIRNPEGGSEPAIAIAANGTMAVTSLPWFYRFAPAGTHLWTGPFGSTPLFQGWLDADLQVPGNATIIGGDDADVDFGASGTLHAGTLIAFVEFSPDGSRHLVNVGICAVTCPDATAPGFSLSGCTKTILETAGADRPWVTSEGQRVYLSYHDPTTVNLIRIQRSDDDGYTWTRVGDPIVGQAGVTADSTFMNIQGPIVADPLTHNVYDIFAAGVPGILKAQTILMNQIYVSVSTDYGNTWAANLVFATAPGTSLDNVFPSLALDPTTGKLYAVWSDAQTTWFAASSDQAAHWSPPVAVNLAPASTTVFPWVAAYNGTVDVVYYGTTAASKDDPTAVWNVYLAQTTDEGANFVQSTASNTPNHVGVICTEGSACVRSTRTMLDLFKVAINPQNGRAAVAYADDTLTQDSSGNPVPQIVLAQQQ